LDDNNEVRRIGQASCSETVLLAMAVLVVSKEAWVFWRELESSEVQESGV